MAEKRRLLNEMDKCFKKVDEGFEIFDEIMAKMSEANSDNQREKFQDDLKKEIKKLQRLRDQIKGWQNSSEIKDKEKLSQYRKLIEQRMETFKDIERENKTKPHSKQGLSAEDKLDPKEKEKSDTIEWLNNQIRRIQDEIDRTESKLETMTTNEGGRKRGKKDDPKKNDKEKIEELKKHLERVKFHLTNWEVVMRLITNEKLEIRDVLTKLKEPIEMYIEALDPDSDLDPESLDPEALDIYEELNLSSFIPQLAGLSIGSIDDDNKSIGENGCTINHRNSLSDSPTLQLKDHDELLKQRHQSGSEGKTLTVKSVNSTPLKLMRLGRISAESSSMSSPPPQTPPPPPPSIPYNSIAAGTASTAAVKSCGLSITNVTPPVTQGLAFSTFTAGFLGNNNNRDDNDENCIYNLTSNTSVDTSLTLNVETVSTKKQIIDDLNNFNALRQNAGNFQNLSGTTFSNTINEDTKNQSQTIANVLAGVPPISSVSQNKNTDETLIQPFSAATQSDVGALSNAEVLNITLNLAQQQNVDDLNQNTLRQVLRMGQNTEKNTQPQTTTIPPWLGASPLGLVQINGELEMQLNMLEVALSRVPLQTDSEKPRNYLPKIPYPTPDYYPQVPPLNADTIEYYLRLAPETLFFIFYYMEGTRAQLLAARALKKLSWRFHTKYLMWFQRHEEPKQITDDFEQGTYVYFDFERWAQRKKEQFTFEYKFLEDKEFE